jgi:hypothetical protein
MPSEAGPSGRQHACPTRSVAQDHEDDAQLRRCEHAEQEPKRSPVYRPVTLLSFPGVTGCVTQRQRPGPLAPGLSLSTGPEPERLLRSHLQRAIILIPKSVQGLVTVGPRRCTMRLVAQTKVRSHAAGAAPWRQAGDVSAGSLPGLQYRYSNATRPPAPVTSM